MRKVTPATARARSRWPAARVATWAAWAPLSCAVKVAAAYEQVIADFESDPESEKEN